MLNSSHAYYKISFRHFTFYVFRFTFLRLRACHHSRTHIHTFARDGESLAATNAVHNGDPAHGPDGSAGG